MKTVQDLYDHCITEARKCHALNVASRSRGLATSLWRGKADAYSDVAFTLANSFGCVAEEQEEKPDLTQK